MLYYNIKCVIESIHNMMKLTFSWLKDKYIYSNFFFLEQTNKNNNKKSEIRQLPHRHHMKQKRVYQT